MANEVNDGNDKVERINQGDRTSENTSKDSVIGGDRKDHQEIHSEASKAGQTFDTFSDNNDDQSFKAIQPATSSFGIDFGDGTVETAKGKVAKPHTQEFFESKAHGAMAAFNEQDQKPKYRPDQLIAANITPSNPIVSDAANYAELDEIKDTKDSSIKVSQGLPTDVHTHFESGEALRPAMEAAGKLGKVAIESGIEAGKKAFDDAMHPYRGKIESTMKQIPESAWNQAYDAFPQFKKAGLSKQQAIEVMKAIVRNELFNYSVVDGQDDSKTKESGNPHHIPKLRPAGDATLGFSQLSMNGVKKRADEYPDQIGKFKGKEADALLDPKNTPLLVAATLSHNLEMYQRHNVPITEETLGYSYNPPKGFPLLPTSKHLQASDHVANVKHHLDIIRGKVEPEPNER